MEKVIKKYLNERTILLDNDDVEMLKKFIDIANKKPVGPMHAITSDMSKMLKKMPKKLKSGKINISNDEGDLLDFILQDLLDDGIDDPKLRKILQKMINKI